MHSLDGQTAIVDIFSMWNGTADITGEVARLAILFSDLDSREFPDAVLTNAGVREAVRRDLQEIVTENLGEFSIEVDAVEIRKGSLSIEAVLATAYIAVINYPKFRDGLSQLAIDLKRASQKIKATLRRLAST